MKENIIFVKQYVEKDDFDNWVTINIGDKAQLRDDINGVVEFNTGFERTTVIEGISPSYYAHLRTDN